MTQTLPTACPDCLRRGEALARLAPYIDRHLSGKATAAREVVELLALPIDALCDAVRGENAVPSLASWLDAASDAARRREIEAASCWSVCPHTKSHPYPAGLSSAGIAIALYGRGDPALLHPLFKPVQSVTVVGARRASSYGREIARELGADLSRDGRIVVSGLAFGIDACAHRGALEGRAPTIAVLGTGPDVCYPAAHRSLWRRVQEGGLVLSELPPGTGAWRWTFPARNRVMAALSAATVVVESAERGGSMFTAELAESYQRVVGAVPGPVNARCSLGPNQLLADGAQVIRDAGDVSTS